MSASRRLIADINIKLGRVPAGSRASDHSQIAAVELRNCIQITGTGASALTNAADRTIKQSDRWTVVTGKIM